MKEKSLVEQAHGHLRETQDEHGNDISRIFELFKLLMGILKNQSSRCRVSNKIFHAR
jgi:hypothetical protein